MKRAAAFAMALCLALACAAAQGEAMEEQSGLAQAQPLTGEHAWPADSFVRSALGLALSSVCQVRPWASWTSASVSPSLSTYRSLSGQTAFSSFTGPSPGAAG